MPYLSMLTSCSVDEILLSKYMNWSPNFRGLPFNDQMAQLHKDAACCFEQLQEATPLKTADKYSFTSHLPNYPNKTSLA